MLIPATVEGVALVSVAVEGATVVAVQLLPLSAKRSSPSHISQTEPEDSKHLTQPSTLQSSSAWSCKNVSRDLPPQLGLHNFKVTELGRP